MTWKSYGDQTVAAKNGRAESKPEALSMPLMLTVPVSFSVPPAFTPWRMKNVPRVTMKLGSFVRTTV